MSKNAFLHFSGQSLKSVALPSSMVVLTEYDEKVEVQLDKDGYIAGGKTTKDENSIPASDSRGQKWAAKASAKAGL